MNVSSKERSLRRRLLFNAMPKTTSEEVVNLCIDILESEFGDEPDIKYSHLVKRLGEAVEGNMNFGPVLGRIMIAKRKPLDQIGPDPGGRRGSSNQVKLKAHEIVLNHMLNQISEHIRNRETQKDAEYRRGLLANCLASPISETCKETLEEWSFDSEASPVRGSVTDFQRVINESYVWMCIAMGPIEADKFLHHVVASAERLPESFEFSPKSLL